MYIKLYRRHIKLKVDIYFAKFSVALERKLLSLGLEYVILPILISQPSSVSSYSNRQIAV